MGEKVKNMKLESVTLKIVVIWLMVVILLSIIKVCDIAVTEKISEASRALCEEAYFEGQKDYANGDIRIKYIEEDSCYHWTKSPWNKEEKHERNRPEDDR